MSICYFRLLPNKSYFSSLFRTNILIFPLIAASSLIWIGERGHWVVSDLNHVASTKLVDDEVGGNVPKLVT